MKRKLSVAVIFLTGLLLIVGCGGSPDDGSGAESVSTVSSVSEESSVASSEVSSLPEETTSDEPSEPEETTSDASSEESPGEYAPWREEGEPDLGNLKLPSIPEEGFSFLNRSLTLRVGESATVGYEFKPVGASNRALTWSSSDENVVKVEGGRLTAVGLGSATVRAQTVNGRSAECRVTVVAQGTLSPLGALAASLANGNFDGWKFSKYDVELDGTAELFVRRMGEDGVPVVTIYRASGDVVTSFATGSDEEWAMWRRLKTGSRYLLLSYTRTTADGGTRSVLEEVTASGGMPVRQAIFARETAPDGTVTYYRSSGGELTSCDEASYRRARETYFADHRQIPETVLKWVTGRNAGEVDEALRAINLSW